MGFAEKYTTQAKIDADTTNKEAKKTIISNDAYSLSETIEALIDKIERVRVRL